MGLARVPNPSVCPGTRLVPSWVTEEAAPSQRGLRPHFQSSRTWTEVSPMKMDLAVPCQPLTISQDNRARFSILLFNHFTVIAPRNSCIPGREKFSLLCGMQSLYSFTLISTFGTVREESQDVSILQGYKWDGRTPDRQDKYREWLRTLGRSMLSLH